MVVNYVCGSQLVHKSIISIFIISSICDSKQLGKEVLLDSDVPCINRFVDIVASISHDMIVTCEIHFTDTWSKLDLLPLVVFMQFIYEHLKCLCVVRIQSLHVMDKIKKIKVDVLNMLYKADLHICLEIQLLLLFSLNQLQSVS